MRHALEEKSARRARLMALPYPEKVRIVERLRTAALQIKAATLHAEAATYRVRPKQVGTSK